MKCAYCGRQINPERDYHLVVGWERIRPPASTKGKSLSGQRRKDKHACADCVDDLKRGTLNQESLI